MLVTLLQLFKVIGQYCIENYWSMLHRNTFEMFHTILKRLYSSQKCIFKVFNT